MNPIDLGGLHLARPLWLLALPLVLALAWRATRSDTGAAGAWARVCDAELLGWLRVAPIGARRAPLALLAAGLALACVALAGPAWRHQKMPLFRSLAARVVVLDLSRSMDAPDLSPNRLTQARFKTADLLRRSADGQTGLVVFAGDAYVVAPLTQDVNTLLNLLPALDPSIMPVQGSIASRGIVLAVKLMRNAGVRHGDIVLITDGVDGAAAGAAADARSDGYRVDVLAVGTVEGAPLPREGGGFVKDAQGNIVVPGVNLSALERVARSGGGRFARLVTGDADLDSLLGPRDGAPRGANARQGTRTSVRWRDEGPWLVVALLPLAALAFRRGWLLALVLPVALGALGPVRAAHAFGWSALWARPDQRAARLLDSGDAKAAAALSDAPPQWRGGAQYRAGEYERAAASFAAVDTPDGHYDRGNALARAGHYEQALAEYRRALARDPHMGDARHNAALIEKLLRQEARKQRTAQQQARGNGGTRQGNGNGNGNGNGKANANSNASARQQTQPSHATTRAGAAPRGGETGTGRRRDAGTQVARGGGPGAPEEGSKTPPVHGTTAQAHAQRQRGEAGQATGRAGANSESEAAWAQWLRRVPDDPGGLLRNKFALEQARRSRERSQVKQPW